MTKYSCGFAFEGNKVALIVKNRPAFMVGKMNGIGGHVEEDESFLDCMVREFREEAGHHTDKNQWIPFAHLTGGRSEIVFFRTYLSEMDDLLETRTDEPVVIVPVNTVNEFNAMYNVPWLLRMAQSHAVSNAVEIYRVQEVGRAS